MGIVGCFFFELRLFFFIFFGWCLSLVLVAFFCSKRVKMSIQYKVCNLKSLLAKKTYYRESLFNLKLFEIACANSVVKFLPNPSIFHAKNIGKKIWNPKLKDMDVCKDSLKSYSQITIQSTNPNYNPRFEALKCILVSNNW